jgi:hypothetical protein
MLLMHTIFYTHQDSKVPLDTRVDMTLHMKHYRSLRSPASRHHNLSSWQCLGMHLTQLPFVSSARLHQDKRMSRPPGHEADNDKHEPNSKKPKQSNKWPVVNNAPSTAIVGIIPLGGKL